MNLGRSELNVAVAAAAVLAGPLLWRWFRTWLRRPVTPDPWGAEVAEAMEQPGATPVCPHCQCPHDANRWFCPECGHSVGEYNNLSPYLYLFSLGEILREGTNGRIRRSWLTVAGLLVLSLAEYLVLAPCYWFFFFRNLSRQADAGKTEDAPPVIARS
jgi:hypothetical protein